MSHSDHMADAMRYGAYAADELKRRKAQREYDRAVKWVMRLAFVGAVAALALGILALIGLPTH